MKKLLLTSVVLLLALMAQAQTKIAPKLTKGYKVTYSEVAEMETAGTPVKVSSEAQYVVTDVTPTGAVIEAINNGVKIEGDDSNPMVAMLGIFQKVMDGVTVRMATDADGKVTKIINGAELKEKAMAGVGKLLDKLYSETPNLAELMPREAMMEEFNEKLSEENILDNYYNGNDVLSLNGKTLQNGATEKFEKEGMKMKRMFFVAGKNVVVNSSLDMTKDELKQLIIDQVTKEMPEQAEVVKQNIDMLMGQMTFEVKSKSTYVFQDNGWVKSIVTEGTQEIMGQSSKEKTTITLKQ